MQEEWPDYLHEVGERAAPTPRPTPAPLSGPGTRPDRAEHWNRLCLTAALEHLSQRRQQVETLKRRCAILAALALLEGGVLLGLLLRYLSG